MKDRAAGSKIPSGSIEFAVRIELEKRQKSKRRKTNCNTRGRENCLDCKSAPLGEWKLGSVRTPEDIRCTKEGSKADSEETRLRMHSKNRECADCPNCKHPHH